jgi:hypothetical protein
MDQEVKVVTGVECPQCKERLFSWHVHDFHYCGCGATFVDGGREYLRYGWNGPRPKEIEFDPTADEMPYYAPKKAEAPWPY